EIVRCRLGDQAAACGDHNSVETLHDDLKALALEPPEHSLSVGSKNFGELHSAGALYLAIQFDERHIKRLGRALSERGFPGTAQADERNPTFRPIATPTN